MNVPMQIGSPCSANALSKLIGNGNRSISKTAHALLSVISRGKYSNADIIRNLAIYLAEKSIDILNPIGI